jgi:hypothetical protein
VPACLSLLAPPAKKGAKTECATLWPWQGMGLAMVRALNRSLKGGVGPSSCMAGFWMLQGLYKVGWQHREAADLALEVMVAQGQFSWRNMLAQGATCTMETWPSGTAPGSGGTGDCTDIRQPDGRVARWLRAASLDSTRVVSYLFEMRACA